MKIPPITVAPDGERIAIPGWLLHPRADHYVLRVVGEAMIEDGVCDGDFVVVRRCSAASEGEMVIAVVGDDAVLRRFYLEHVPGGDLRDAVVRLEASNPAIEAIRLPFADLTIQGVAVGLIRRFDRKEPA